MTECVCGFLNWCGPAAYIKARSIVWKHGIYTWCNVLQLQQPRKWICFASIIDPGSEIVHSNDSRSHLCIIDWTLHTWRQHSWEHVHHERCACICAACAAPVHARRLIMHHVPSGRLVSVSGRRQQRRGSVIKKLLLQAEALANAHVHRDTRTHTHTPTVHRHRIKIGKLRKNNLGFVPAADVAATARATLFLAVLAQYINDCCSCFLIKQMWKDVYAYT